MARVRRGEPAPRWVPSAEGDAGIWDSDGTPRVKFVWAQERDHMIRHDPARVLREVVAKRLMLNEALSSRHLVTGDHYMDCPLVTEADGVDTATADRIRALNDDYRKESGQDPKCAERCGRDVRVHRTLELLALPFVDHPDYMRALLADQA
ncbi:DUF6221 family protein [Streptomyces drozdowiczii]|uniref:DUF6221 family protein n=1 Tax=Streptomyces drozdowiczii TaxID=202862 RepID=UPI00403C5685